MFDAFDLREGASLVVRRRVAIGSAWKVGLIVGPSGAGKSTIARQMFGPEHTNVWGGKSVIDSFDSALTVDQVSSALSAVGFNTIPAWLRAYGTLSNGEKFRCDSRERSWSTNRWCGSTNSRRCRSLGGEDRLARACAVRARAARSTIRRVRMPLRCDRLAATRLGTRTGKHGVCMEVGSATTDHPRSRSTCLDLALASLRSLSLYDCGITSCGTMLLA